MINSCATLEELEELHHDESFLATYQTQQFKEAFEKRFNELNEEVKRQQELWTANKINEINSVSTLKELEEIDFPNEDTFCIPYNNKKDSLIKQEEQQRIYKSIQAINSCSNIEQIKELKDIEDTEDVRTTYNQRRDFLEQQEELNKIKAEQEEKRKQEEQKQKEEEQQKQKELQEQEKKKELYKAEVLACNTQDELMSLFSETKY